MLKLLILLITISLLACCNESLPQNIEVSTKPTPTLTESEKTGKAKLIAQNKEETEKFVGEESKFYGLSNLSEKKLSDKDLEVRLWRFSAFGDRHLVFVLTRTNEIWSAKLIQRTIDQKIIVSNISDKKRFAKYSQGKLENPKSGWNNLWKKIIDAKILTLPDGREVGIEPLPDSWEFIVETKVDNKYRVYSYLCPEIFEETPEAQEMVKIINVISDEFSLEDFDYHNFMLP